jgi:hypothetical protein
MLQRSTPYFTPPTGNYYSTQFVEISTSTDGATIYYTDDGSDPDETSILYVAPIEVSSTTTLKAKAYKIGYDPSNIATAVYTFPPTTDVATIAALRLGATDGTVYKLTGEAIITFTQTFRNQKFIQDATAAILIDDLSGIIQGSYAIGDGITDVVGTLNIFSGMLQFTPVADADGPFTPAGSITPTVITMMQLVNNFEDYESQLVTIEDVSFTEADGVLTFANGSVYDISDGVTSGDFRASFFDVDYIGEVVPVIPQNITGILNERESVPIGKFITARNLADIEAVPSLVEPPVSFTATTINSNQINLDFEVNASGDDVVIVYNSTGIFSDPSGDPPAIDDPFAGGTLFYYGTNSPQIHSGLAAEETVYYRAFSYDKEYYSPGLNANATTYAVEPSNHVTGLSATANSASSITVAWTDSDASGYLIKGSTVDFNDIAAPVDGISEADGTVVKNVAAGVESHEFTGLTASTEYFFKIFPYNGVGAAVNYKTDGIIPEASATTLDPPPSPYADVLLRPQQIDLSETTSQSAVLMEIGNYPTDDVRYRLYNGGNQYNSWDGVEFVTSNQYSLGPQVPGTPSTSSKFWILFERGSNNTTLANYRDRLGPDYSSNYQTEALPAATAMVTPYDISLSIPFTGTYALDVKYVVLGFDAEVGGNLISATSSALTTGDFVLKAEEGTIIRRIEVRTVLDVLVDELIGEWPSAVPENRTVDGITLGVDDTECYDATNNITVTNTTIGNGASVEFRAGVNIIFGDGFIAQEGSYMLATITDVYCTLPPAMLASEEIIVPEIQNAINELETTFKVYPNPNSGMFALELSGVEETAKVTVEIYSMMGERLLQSDLSGSQVYQFDLSAMPKGVYILRIMNGGQAEIQRIIKQ